MTTPPYDSSRRISIRRSPTKEEVLAILRNVTQESYHQPIEDDPRGSISAYRQMAQQSAVVADQAFTHQQASFFLPYPTQGKPPGSGLTKATFQAQIQRTKDLQDGRILEISALEMVGNQGRLYVNAARVEWLPYDPEPSKAIDMVSENPGYVGNLDHLADPDTGLLTNPHTGEPALEILDIADQSDRTADGASVVSILGGPSQIRDSGIPDQFLASDLGLYVEILASGTAADVGRILKIIAFEDPDLEDPPASGKFPNRITVDDGPLRFQLSSAQADDGGVFTDETIVARNDTPDTMTLLPATVAVGDAYYFGAIGPFDRIELNISTAGEGDWVVVWEFWSGAAWDAVGDIVDNTDGFKLPGLIDILTPSTPGWVATTVNSVTAYYVRARVTSVTTTTTQPLGQTATVFQPGELTADDGGIEWRVLDWRDMGFEIVSMTTPTGGTDDVLGLSGAGRGVYQQTNESDDQFRQRAARLADAVSPNAINRAINRELYPYGLRGLAIDVSNGFDGFFIDEDFIDYYEPGDPDGAPASPFKLILSTQEAYGWFFVFVPCIGEGFDFGFSWDQGPEEPIGGVQIAPAWELGWWDGFAVNADSTYRSIWQAVEELRAGGVGFTMIKDCDLNEDPCPPPS